MSAILPRQMLHWLFSELLSSIFGESPIQQRQIQLRFDSRQVLGQSRQVQVRFETGQGANHIRQVQIQLHIKSMETSSSQLSFVKSKGKKVQSGLTYLLDFKLVKST